MYEYGCKYFYSVLITACRGKKNLLGGKFVFPQRGLLIDPGERLRQKEKTYCARKLVDSQSRSVDISIAPALASINCTFDSWQRLHVYLMIVPLLLSLLVGKEERFYSTIIRLTNQRKGQTKLSLRDPMVRFGAASVKGSVVRVERAME